MNREEAVQADEETDPSLTPASLTSDEPPPALPMIEAAYLPGQAFDEMYAAGGAVRDHYGGPTPA